MPMLTMRYVFADGLVDINRVPELVGMPVPTRRYAMTRQCHTEHDADVKQVAPLLIEALKLVGDRQDAKPRHDRRQPLSTQARLRAAEWDTRYTGD
jgi:hypothetical protein